MLVFLALLPLAWAYQLPFLAQQQTQQPLNPTINLAANLNFFNYAAQAATRVINKRVSQIQLPDQDTTEFVDGFGNVDLIFRNVILQFVRVSESDVIASISEKTIDLTFNAVAFSIEVDVRYRQQPFPNWKGHGHLKLDGKEGRIGFGVQMQAIDRSIVVSVPNSPSVEFGSLEMKVSQSGAAWFYNILSGMFKNKLRNIVYAKIMEALQKTVPDEANKFTKALPGLFPIPFQSGLALNVSMKDTITYTTDHVEAGIFGLLQTSLKVRAAAYDCPHLHQEIASPQPSLTQAGMVRMAIHDTMLNCAGYTLFTENYLNLMLNQSQVPAEASLLLNTSTWERAIPGLKQIFPNGAPMILKLFLTSQPMAKIFEKDGVIAYADDIIVQFFDDALGKLFSISLNVQLGAIGDFVPRSNDDLALKILLTMAEFDIKLIESSVGEIDVGLLQLMMKVGAGSFLERLTDWLEANDVDIPRFSRWISFPHSRLVFVDSMFALETDIRFND